MSKKIKNNTSGTKNGGRNIFKKKKQKEHFKNKRKSIISKHKNLISNSKLKKNTQKIKRKLKQAHKDGKSHTPDNFVHFTDAKVVKKHKKKMQSFAEEESNSPKLVAGSHKLDITRLKEMLDVKKKESKKKSENTKPLSLREKMMAKLRASRFRYLNETLYNNESSESKKYFKDDPDAFKAYHEGYKQQVEQWPLNPLDIIISSIKKMPKEYIIADFGCGEARLASSVNHKVHSFDFVSLNENVTVCDIAHTPLLTNGINVVVFCLSLMGTNLKDYIVEANRVLKKGGILKIAEVESRFERVEDFIKILDDYGFKCTWKDLSHNLFYFLDFKKEKDISGKKSKLIPITLKPCFYKKR
ncbi:ribosomal RNA-processing protein 8 [Colletes gigas]|uniref:ribosomal RNA-processing protein 8 n=1 Tax=Colletes gigas TaxID=935657 RepID=UPI001C9B14CC|nr:ribosomal RNA-processing protein 8 [Colletes gigas]